MEDESVFQRIGGAYGGIFIIFLLFIACGCNPEAFVKPINPSSRHFTVREDGDTIKVRFGTDDWSVASVILDGKPSNGSEVHPPWRVSMGKENHKRRIHYVLQKSGERELELFSCRTFQTAK